MAFQNAGVPLVPVFWEQFGNEYYSFLVQVPGSLLVLELMSATQTMLPSPRYRSPHPRYTFPSADATPEATFGANLVRVPCVLLYRSPTTKPRLKVIPT